MKLNTIKFYLQPAFLICVAVLATAASVVIEPVSKEPLPLKKPLDLLDEKGLAPYKVISKDKIDNDDVLRSLGTKYYIQWYLEDSNAATDSAVRRCMLFITYYEVPDRVPHVPEECYTGGGYRRLSSESMTLQVKRDGTNVKIPVRYLTFGGGRSSQWQSDADFSVLYFFKVNGEYGNNRADARLALNKNILGKYSYFSKVEWKFFNSRFGIAIYPEKSEAVAASQKLLAVILPILEKEYWPDWKE